MPNRISEPDGTTTLTEELTRRGFLGGTAAFGATGLSLGAARYTQAGIAKIDGDVAVRAGTYESVPLAKEAVRIGVMQTRVHPVDAASPEKGRRENLEHMTILIQNAQEWNPPSDILFFHEFPITGFKFDWSRNDINRLAIDLPGPETEVLGTLAKKYGCYIVFGSYANDSDWPAHVLSITTIIGPDGAIVGKHWKARNILGAFRLGNRPVELMTTTIYNVLDRYIEMYGADAVHAVTRTPIGNLCTSSVQREPELFRAMAMKGGEIFLRTASGGFSPSDIEMCATYNRAYTAICNNAVSPGNAFFEDAGSGGSAIYDDSGRVMAIARSEAEQLVSAVVPIRDFRARHRIPDLAWALYSPVFGKYVPKYPPSKFTEHLPVDLGDAGKYLNDPKNTNW